MIDMTASSQSSVAWPQPPKELLDLFGRDDVDATEPTIAFISGLPLSDEHSNAEAARHYRQVALAHSRSGRTNLADAFHEIANLLWP